MKPKKEPSGPSITEAIVDLVDYGELRNSVVGESHYQLLRERQKDPIRSAGGFGGKVLCLPFERFRRRDLTVTGPPGLGPEWVGEEIQPGASDLLSWSAVRRLGAVVLSDLSGRAVVPLVTRLPIPEWVPEIGMSLPTSGDLGTDQIVLSPKRLSAQVIVSLQLLRQTGADFDRILIADLSRALSSYLDQEILYGPSGPDRITGIISWPGTHRVDYLATDPLWPMLVSCETLVADANLSLDSFGNIVSPAVRDKLRITPTWPDQGNLCWNEMLSPISSKQITDDRLFFGAFDLCTIGVFGPSVDLLINPFTQATFGQVQIVVNGFFDSGLRMGAGFGMTTNPIPLARRANTKAELAAAKKEKAA
jgi:hypothetical protein